MQNELAGTCQSTRGDYSVTTPGNISSSKGRSRRATLSVDEHSGRLISLTSRILQDRERPPNVTSCLSRGSSR